MALPLQAYAMAEVSVELPFTVEDINGTVVIEAIDGAPLPEVTEFKDVTEGVFKISYTQPDTYYYRIYQQIPDNADTVNYDTTVYRVAVFVLSDDEGVLNAVYSISIEGKAEKQESIVFENSIPRENDTTTENTTEQTTAKPETTQPDTTQTATEQATVEQTTVTPPSTTEAEDEQSTAPQPPEAEITTVPTTPQAATPNTGDNNNLGIWIGISVLSLVGILVLLIAGRRKKADK